MRLLILIILAPIFFITYILASVFILRLKKKKKEISIMDIIGRTILAGTTTFLAGAFIGALLLIRSPGSFSGEGGLNALGAIFWGLMFAVGIIASMPLVVLMKWIGTRNTRSEDN